MRRLCLCLLLVFSACTEKKTAMAVPVAHQPAPLKPMLTKPSVALPAPQATKNCASQEEADALNMRVLQSDLVVGSLSCKLHNDYADFVKSNKKALADHALVMKRYFDRTGSGTAGMDRFVTTLANDSSKHSLNNHETAFCGQARGLFQELKAFSSTQLSSKLANTPDIVIRRNIPLCPPATADVNRAGPKATTPMKDALKR